MGGEKGEQTARPHYHMGSPPRRRGKDKEHPPLPGAGRITPAWAGKRHTAGHWVQGTTDHPRVGGEKSVRLFCIPSRLGSPPHGRGKDCWPHSKEDVMGITPAWAGKSRRCCLPGSPRRDHPRAGGEKLQPMIFSISAWGSPPHGRGKGFTCSFASVRLRITPAWAGKSPASQPWSPPLWMMVIRPRP